MTALLTFEQASDLIIERAKQLTAPLIKTRGHDRPPFLSEEFARLQGIKEIVQSDLGEIGALLLRFSQGSVIKLNEKHSPARRNFSCAHELGHVLVSELELDSRLEKIEFRTFNPQAQTKAHARAKERLCDVAATELLMPELIFKQYLLRFGVSALSIEKLAKVFKVSIQTTTMRIAEVSAEPCLALLWQHRPVNKPKGLQLDWCKGPGRNPSGKSRYMPVHEIVPNTSTLYKAYKGNDLVKCRKLFKIGTITKNLHIESKGFGYNERRFVVSLAFLNR